jgi:hypothetical protein
MNTVDAREPAASDHVQGSISDPAVGLSAEAAAGTVATYFAAFRWDATLDATTMSAEAFLTAALGIGARRD